MLRKVGDHHATVTIHGKIARLTDGSRIDPTHIQNLILIGPGQVKSLDGVAAPVQNQNLETIHGHSHRAVGPDHGCIEFVPAAVS